MPGEQSGKAPGRIGCSPRPPKAASTPKPALVFTEEISYADAQEWIGVGKGEYNRWPRETRVWLVIFKGRWLLTPMGPGPSPTPIEYEGCVLTLFTARDGEWIAMGDAVCPVQ